MRDFIAGLIAGSGLFALGYIIAEVRSRRPKRHRLRGNYFDARSPFRIGSCGPEPVVERSEELIAREARRALREWIAPEARAEIEDLASVKRREGWHGKTSRRSGKTA